MEDHESKGEVKVEKKRGRMVLVLALVVLAAGTTAAGALFGPRFLTPPAPAPRGSSAAPAEHDRVAAVTNLPPIVVDTRSLEGDLHHIKCSLALELRDGVSTDDMKNYTPRAREAAVAYLRQQPFEEITDPKRFSTVQKTLDSHIRAAVGKSRVVRVVVTDFVAQ